MGAVPLRSKGSHSVIYGAADEAALFPQGIFWGQYSGNRGAKVTVALFKYGARNLEFCTKERIKQIFAGVFFR